MHFSPTRAHAYRPPNATATSNPTRPLSLDTVTDGKVQTPEQHHRHHHGRRRDLAPLSRAEEASRREPTSTIGSPGLLTMQTSFIAAAVAPNSPLLNPISRPTHLPPAARCPAVAVPPPPLLISIEPSSIPIVVLLASCGARILLASTFRVEATPYLIRLWVIDRAAFSPTLRTARSVTDGTVISIPPTSASSTDHTEKTLKPNVHTTRPVLGPIVGGVDPPMQLLLNNPHRMRASNMATSTTRSGGSGTPVSEKARALQRPTRLSCHPAARSGYFLQASQGDLARSPAFRARLESCPPHLDTSSRPLGLPAANSTARPLALLMSLGVIGPARSRRKP
ncbi:hypothetical protein K402DRAFT_401205 [Aulographum hederae CBS 113979]|uniref:Uncharacterized protein n=1 Tax=Aulographum hederae CBS 113979 TaxID=1176131 RepID=A0A6G1HBC1_9PEZI|nr:hypothetical protein K402DRAFT_401205 [Aulographum hederae CBS 113979]